MKKKLPIHHPSVRKLTPSKNLFASLARAIIYQQLSGKAAGSIERKFIALFPLNPRSGSGDRKNGLAKKKFPTPEDVLGFTDEQFQSAGVSAQKRKYMRDLATKFIDKTIKEKKLRTMNDDDIRNHLILVKGIGHWTIDMFLMFALNRPNILPVGDLGVRKGFQKAFKLHSLPDEKKMRLLAREYDGEHTQLSLYLWSILDGNTETM